MSDKQKPLQKEKKRSLANNYTYHWMLCTISLKPVSLTSQKWKCASRITPTDWNTLKNWWITWELSLRAEGKEALTHHRRSPMLKREEQVLVIARKRGQLMYQGLEIVIFPDLSSTLAKRWATFMDVKSRLRPKVLSALSHSALCYRSISGLFNRWPVTVNHGSQITGWA